MYDEAMMGDLPNGTESLSVGALTSNYTVTGLVGGADWEDSLSFTVPSGYVFSSLPLVTYEDPVTGGDGNLGFLFINTGTTSFSPDFDNIPDMLGGIVLLSSEIGDLLPKLANATLDPAAAAQTPTPPLGQGFTIPLPAGDYALTLFNGPLDSGEPSALALYEVIIGISPA